MRIQKNWFLKGFSFAREQKKKNWILCVSRINCFSIVFCKFFWNVDSRDLRLFCLNFFAWLMHTWVERNQLFSMTVFGGWSLDVFLRESFVLGSSIILIHKTDICVLKFWRQTNPTCSGNICFVHKS